MSDTNLTFTLNGNSYPFAAAQVKERKTKSGKVTPALEFFTVESTEPGVLGGFFTDLLTLADSKKAGNAREVFAGLFHKVFKNAFIEVENVDTKDVQDIWDDMLADIVTVGRQTVDLEQISKEIIEEQQFLGQFLVLPYDDESTAAAKNTAREAAGLSEDEFCRRMVAVSSRQADFLRLSHEHDVKSAELSAKRAAAKAKKLAETAAAAPAN